MVSKQIKRFVASYFNSYWIPITLAIVAFLLLRVFSLANYIPNIFFIWGAISFLGVLSAGVYNFTQKRTAKGAVNAFLSLSILAFIGFAVMAMLAFASMFGESEDGFGKDIVIPEDMVMEEPINALEPGFKESKYSIVEPRTNETEVDPKGKMFVDILLDKKNKGSLEIDTDLPVLAEFTSKKRQKLINYLKVTPHWRIVQGQKTYAVRRFVGKGFFGNEGLGFLDGANGNYTNFDFESSSNQSDKDSYFQFKIILSLDGKIEKGSWARDFPTLNVGTGIKKLKTKRISNDEFISCLVLASDGVTLEIKELTKQKRRFITQLACKMIAEELQTVLDSKPMTTSEFEQKMIKAGRAIKGQTDIWIENGMQGGMYNVYASINPKEPGYAYLKIFEATKNTPLSNEVLKFKSKEVMVFSENDNLKFIYQSPITIYEGDWGVYYPARFELWFVPDSGQQERKLIEQIFKVEGLDEVSLAGNFAD